MRRIFPLLPRVCTRPVLCTSTRTLNPHFGLRYSTDSAAETAPSAATETPKVHRESVKTIFGSKSAGDVVRIRGWVRALRKQKMFTFFDVNDGSSFLRLPVVVKSEWVPHDLTMHSAVEVTGELANSPKSLEVLELQPSEPIKVIGPCIQEQYPLGGKIPYSDEYIRNYIHLRSKTNRFSSLFRLRSAATKAVNDFFSQNDYIQIHTPILTSNDCEGAGEVFLARPANANLMLEKRNVTSTRPTSPKIIKKLQTHDHDKLPFDGQKHVHSHQCEACDNIFTHTHAKKPAHVSKTYDNHYCDDHKHLRKDGPKSFDPDEAFFDRKAFLTVSSQLHLEAMVSGLEKVWTFSPVFRSENNQTTRHLSEFYMVEAEIGFAYEMEQILNPMEALVKHVIHSVLYGNAAEWSFCTGPENDPELRKLLEHILKRPFTVMTYKDASQLLESKAATTVSPKSGINREQELLLVEKLNDNTPVFLVDWPSDIKPFYMKQLPGDPSRVAAVDLLVPRVGELCGGSLREDNLDNLIARTMTADPTGQLTRSLEWYYDFRRFGGTPTGGFGLGFDRLLQLILGIHNIRDVVPFPRWPHNCPN